MWKYPPVTLCTRNTCSHFSPDLPVIFVICLTAISFISSCLQMCTPAVQVSALRNPALSFLDCLVLLVSSFTVQVKRRFKPVVPSHVLPHGKEGSGTMTSRPCCSVSDNTKTCSQFRSSSSQTIFFLSFRDDIHDRLSRVCLRMHGSTSTQGKKQVWNLDDHYRSGCVRMQQTTSVEDSKDRAWRVTGHTQDIRVLGTPLDHPYGAREDPRNIWFFQWDITHGAERTRGVTNISVQSSLKTRHSGYRINAADPASVSLLFPIRYSQWGVREEFGGQDEHCRGRLGELPLQAWLRPDVQTDCYDLPLLPRKTCVAYTIYTLRTLTITDVAQLAHSNDRNRRRRRRNQDDNQVRRTASVVGNITDPRKCSSGRQDLRTRSERSRTQRRNTFLQDATAFGRMCSYVAPAEVQDPPYTIFTSDDRRRRTSDGSAALLLTTWFVGWLRGQ